MRAIPEGKSADGVLVPWKTLRLSEETIAGSGQTQRSVSSHIKLGTSSSVLSKRSVLAYAWHECEMT